MESLCVGLCVRGYEGCSTCENDPVRRGVCVWGGRLRLGCGTCENDALFFPWEYFPRGGGDIQYSHCIGGHADGIIENNLKVCVWKWTYERGV